MAEERNVDERMLRSRSKQMAVGGLLVAGAFVVPAPLSWLLLVGGAGLTVETQIATVRRSRWWARGGEVRVLSEEERRSIAVAAATGAVAAVVCASGRSRRSIATFVGVWALAVAFTEWLQGVIHLSRGMLRMLPVPGGGQEVVTARSEADIVDAVRRARRAGQRVRAVGARNSSPEYRPDHDEGAYLLVDLTSYDQVIDLDVERRRIHVQAGMRQGDLVEAVDSVGLALSALNGSHELTVGGTISTGSICGARYLLNDHVVSVTVVDADGDVVRVDRERDADVFGAYLCSLGLLGVLSSIEYELEPAFNVKGAVRRTDFQDLLQLGEAENVARFDYMVNDWYPNTGEVISRQLHRMPVGQPLSGPPQRLDGMTPVVSAVGQMLSQTTNIVPRLAGPVARIFTLFFRDRDVEAPWYDLLVVDTDFDLAYHPIDYLEVVLPQSEYREFMQRLAAVYERQPELRPLVPVITDWVAPDDRSWIAKNSVADRDQAEMFAVVTVAHQRVERRSTADVLGPAIELGREIGARMHWGKHPWMRDGGSIGASLPPGNFERFRQLRELKDPDGVFLTDLFEEIFVGQRSPTDRMPTQTSAG